MGAVWEWGSHYWGSLEFPLRKPHHSTTLWSEATRSQWNSSKKMGSISWVVAACRWHRNMFLYIDVKYGWWLKSCTTWDVWNPINNGKNYLSTGAGFQPSTVWIHYTCICRPQLSLCRAWFDKNGKSSYIIYDAIISVNSELYTVYT